MHTSSSFRPTSRPRAATRVLVFAVLALGLPSRAHAQPTSAASAEADTLFDQGRQLMDAGKLAEACAAFDASQKLSPAVSTLFNQAQCREQNSQLATAYGLFREAERQTRAPLDEATQNLNHVAIDRAKLLEPRLSMLTLTVAANHRVDGLEVLRDDLVVAAGGWNHPLPADGGKHKIIVRAPGYVSWTTEIEVAPENDTKTVEVPRLVLAPVPPPPLSLRTKLMPILFGSGGVVLLGAGLGADLWARGDYDQAKVEPDDAKQLSLWRSAKTKRYVAQGLAVAGVGCVGVAVWLYLRSHREHSDPAPIARIGTFNVEPVVTTDHAGLQLVRPF